jgi:flagellar biosynthesis GTPase FlhF
MSINEIKIGSIIRVKVGKNLIHAKVIEILEDGLRVCSLGKNKEFNVPSSRVELAGEASEQEQPVTSANTEAAEQVETETEATEVEQPVEQSEATEHSEQPAEQETAEPETEEPATVEVLPEDEAAEFQPSGEDEEDEYVINPAHESDKPVKRMSLLNAAVIVLKDAGPDHPMNCKEILEAILERQLWTPTDCKTPEQTLYGSIFREINTKEHPRIVKSDVKGKFRIAE